MAVLCQRPTAAGEQYIDGAGMRSATRATVATLGVILGISGMCHGFFEVLQGNTPTGGMFIPAIGEAHRMWPHGTEYAFTLIPNFLMTGILAMVVGLSIIIWSVGFVHKKSSPTVYLLLFILLLLVGGGLGQVVFFTLGWAASTRINKPLAWWRKVLPESVRRMLAKVWPWLLVVGALLLVLALEIAITGYVPGVKDPDLALNVMLFSLGVGLGVLLLTVIAGFAHDIERQASTVGA